MPNPYMYWLAWWALMLVSAVIFWFGHNQGFCWHRFKTGGGGMGDAWCCEKCGLDKYPENIGFKFLYKLCGRVKD